MTVGRVEWRRLRPETRASIGSDPECGNGRGCHGSPDGWWWLCEWHDGYEAGLRAAGR